MELRELADIGRADEVATSNDAAEIANALQSILNGSRRFTHRDIVRNGPGSIWLFLQEPLGEAVALPETSAEAGPLALELLRLTNEGGAGYSDQPCDKRVQGWRIRKTTIRGKAAAIAEAAWV